MRPTIEMLRASVLDTPLDKTLHPDLAVRKAWYLIGRITNDCENGKNPRVTAPEIDWIKATIKTFEKRPGFPESANYFLGKWETSFGSSREHRVTKEEKYESRIEAV